VYQVSFGQLRFVAGYPIADTRDRPEWVVTRRSLAVMSAIGAWRPGAVGGLRDLPTPMPTFHLRALTHGE
jgi:hypothetical protein